MSHVSIACPGCGMTAKIDDPKDKFGKRSVYIRCPSCRTKFAVTHGLGNGQLELEHRLALDYPGAENDI